MPIEIVFSVWLMLAVWANVILSIEGRFEPFKPRMRMVMVLLIAIVSPIICGFLVWMVFSSFAKSLWLNRDEV